MSSLFVYGSLMVPEVLEVVVGHVPRLRDATLEDHVRRRLYRAVYPGLVPRRGERAEGRLVVGLGTADLQRVDAFEGGLYQRTPCVVDAEGEQIQAFVYVLRPAERGRLAPEDWDLEAFIEHELPTYLEACRRFATTQAPSP